MSKTIMELRKGDCRYLTGKAIYCAEPQRSGSSYCAEHHKRCFTQMAKREKHVGHPSST